MFENAEYKTNFKIRLYQQSKNALSIRKINLQKSYMYLTADNI